MPVPLHQNWTVRRAALVDVPAVARLIEPVAAGDEPDPAFHSAARLVLAHVGLEAGEFWVATDDDGDIQAAVVLLPPRTDPAGHVTPESDGVTTALRLHLRGTAMIDTDLPDGLPQPHLVLIAVAAADAEPVLETLMAQALPVADASGLPVLNVHPGRALAALLGAGFEPWLPTGKVPVLVRPALEPDGPVVIPMPAAIALSGAAMV